MALVSVADLLLLLLLHEMLLLKGGLVLSLCCLCRGDRSEVMCGML